MPGDQQNAADNPFAADGLDQIQAQTFIRRIEYHEQLGSTNDHALQMAGGSEDQFPLLVLAKSQTSGRGRGANTWWSKSGSLTFSVLVATEAADLPTQRWPQVSLTVGLAVCEALEEVLALGVPTASLHTLPAVQLKWPNDVYVDGKKICGVLVEVPQHCSGKLLLGIGININNSLEDAPAPLQEIAISLCDLTGRRFSLVDVLIRVLQRLASRLEPTTFWDTEVIAGWRQRCFLTGKRIEIDNGTRQTAGSCRGIDDNGALLIETDQIMAPHLAGVVTVLDPIS